MLLARTRPMVAGQHTPSSAPRLARSQGNSRRLLPQAKMYVPDSFGGKSPERKAAEALQKMFTFLAARIVLSQLEGSGRGSLGAYNATSWQDLHDHLHNSPMVDGEKWLAELCAKNEMLGVRLMEVRAAYSADDFEWVNCQKVAVANIKAANIRLMREQAESSFARKMKMSVESRPEPKQ